MGMVTGSRGARSADGRLAAAVALTDQPRDCSVVKTGVYPRASSGWRRGWDGCVGMDAVDLEMRSTLSTRAFDS